MSYGAQFQIKQTPTLPRTYPPIMNRTIRDISHRRTNTRIYAAVVGQGEAYREIINFAWTAYVFLNCYHKDRFQLWTIS